MFNLTIYMYYLYFQVHCVLLNEIKVKLMVSVKDSVIVFYLNFDLFNIALY